MNIINTISDMFKPFIDGEKKPLNYLEVGNLWLYLTICYQTLRIEEVAYNTAQDKDLKKYLLDAKKIHEVAAEEISELLKSEGIALPENTPEKPVVDTLDIPEGAKFKDEEIANLMSFNLLTGINFATRGMTEAIRADVGLIYFKVIMKKTVLGLSVKQLMEKNGWLRIAPYYRP
jgi:hypothetical protein